MFINSPRIAFNTICIIESLHGNSAYRFSLLFFLLSLLLLIIQRTEWKVTKTSEADFCHVLVKQNNSIERVQNCSTVLFADEKLDKSVTPTKGPRP